MRGFLKKPKSDSALTAGGGRYERARKLFAAYGYHLDKCTDEQIAASGIMERITEGPHSLGEIVAAMVLFDFYRFSFEEITGKLLDEAIRMARQTHQPLIVACNLVASVMRNMTADKGPAKSR